jgi:hypothetical protein
MPECTNWGTLAMTTILISVPIGALHTKVNKSSAIIQHDYGEVPQENKSVSCYLESFRNWISQFHMNGHKSRITERLTECHIKIRFSGANAEIMEDRKRIITSCKFRQKRVTQI